MQRHLDEGHSPIGIYPCGKIVKGENKTKLPIGPGWRRSEAPIAADDPLLFKADGTPELDAKGKQKKEMGVDSILRYQPDADIGIAGGFGGACPIDVDTLDEELQQKIRAIFPVAAIRVGNPKKLGALLVRWVGEGPWVELIGPGRHTLVPPSMHPCGKPYVIRRHAWPDRPVIGIISIKSASMCFMDTSHA